MQKRLLCFFLFAFALAIMGHAQQIPTTQGKEFWLSFMRNGYRSTTSTNHLYLIASAKRSCTLTVSSPNTSWTQSTEINNGITTIVIPDAVGYNDLQSGIANKGLFVSATDTVSLYIANETQNSYDAANVLPVQALGSRYMVQTNKSLHYPNSSHAEDNKASFLIVATEDNTQVQITPSCQTMDDHNGTYTITLQVGQCYHVINKNPGYSNNADGDFSGTLIESLDNKPIAVFNGNSVTSVSDEAVNEGYDHVFEQAMPVDNWGKHFVVTKTRANQVLQNDRVKITALYDNTDIWRNGELVYQNLASGASCTFWMTDISCYLESSAPVAVYLYNHSHTSSNTYGDPSMVWISPVEQTLQEVIFSTFTSQTNLDHYVNVVCYTDDVSELYLNGNPVPQSEIQTVSGAPQFSFARVPAEAGMNRLQCPGGLVAHVYGIGDRQGYAYTVGSSARVLTNQLYVNDELVTDDYSTCQSEMLEFRLETNYEPDLVKWNYGDGSPVGYGAETSHTYAVANDYEVEVTVDHVVNGEPLTDTLEMTIHVNPKVELTCVDSTCNPVYYFQGIAFPVPFFGDTIITNMGGCESIYHMNITEGSSQSFVTYDTACLEYEWFDTIRYESGTYIVILNQPGGCDSLYILNLTIGKPPENPVRYKSSCRPYNWDNRVICDTTGTYYLSFTTEDHCVYDSVLHFTRYFEPPFDEIVGLSYVSEATNFWTGRYVYYLDDSTGMNTSHIHWELLDNPPGQGQWELSPHGASCTVTAYSKGERVLKVFTDEGHCDKEAFKTINSTGYAVDEYEVALEVYPNPVKDELVVKGQGLMEVNLYNMLGQRVKRVSAMGDAEVNVNVENLPQALYILEARTKYGNNTRLVSVIK